MFKIIAVLSLALLAVNAYDFSDTYFNQYLFQEYESLNSNLLSRHRRDVSEVAKDEKKSADEMKPMEEMKQMDEMKPSKECDGQFNHMMMMKKDLTCCESNKHDPSYFSMIRETKKQCAMKLRTNNPDVENFDPFNCEYMAKIKDLIICESECVAKTLDLLDENGEIKRDAVVASFKKSMSSDSEVQHNVLEDYVDKCLAKMKGKDLKPAGKCSSAPMELHHCMFGEMVSGCPAESQVNTPRCQKIRERYSKSQTLAFGKHVLHEFLHSGRGRHHGHKDQM
ncbi:uncharacterized protein LOC101889248 [Musca domestica]|uniref:Uncharacterized protein LOC101889248 n=1 Tax=Musca domestica TaxID=7370 RepID=A0ABM3VH51_MUSDO|nr:uncharacterized protein LOC101889248 [Musca domestica]